MIDKEARKKSEDPAQERLREEKSNWNSEVSSTIADLIALKKGINGKKVDSAGIPASKIQESVPPQVSSLLSEVSSKCNAILSAAHQIISDQDSYSSSRRKSHLQAIHDAGGIVKNASWFGSRALTHLTSLRKLKWLERKFRLQMLHTAAELEKRMEVFEEKVMDPKEIPASFALLNSVLLNYHHPFLSQFTNLESQFPSDKTNQNESVQLEDFTIPSAKEEIGEIKPEESKVVTTDKSKDKPTTKVKKEPTPETTSDPEILETPEDAEFRKLEVFFDYLMGPKGNRGAKFGHIKESFAILMNSPNPPRPKEEMGKTLSVFNKSITAAQKFKYEGKKDFMHHELKKMLQSYKEMEKIIYENEGELQKIMPGWKAEKYLDPNYVEPPPPKTDLIPEEDLEFLNKKAGNVSRWLKHQWLKMKNDIESYKALDVVEASKETRHRLDHLMDILENNDSSMDQIKEAIKSINGSFIYLIDKMMVVGKEYMIHQRRSERTKDRYMKEISLAEVRQMAESGRMLRDGFGGLPRL